MNRFTASVWFWLLKNAFFWLIFFQIHRLVFLFHYRAFLNELHWVDVFSCISHAVKLDLSAFAYLMAILLLPFLFSLWINKKIGLRIFKAISYVFIGLIGLIYASEFELFVEWESKLSIKALGYLFNPDEIFSTATWKQSLRFALYGIISTFVFIGWFNKFITDFQPIKKTYLKILLSLAYPLLTFILLRGGLQPIPISQGEVYFSKNHTLNLATVNSPWNILHALVNNYKNMGKNPYSVMDIKQAQTITKTTIGKDCGTSLSFLTKTDSINIVFVILESWAGDMVESCDGLKEITPKFEKLIQNGVFFTNHFASGTRSEQGIASILSGYPGQPGASIIKHEEKFKYLPCLGATFKKKGYQTAFVFGGELNYGNLKAYIYYNDYDKIVERKDLKHLPSGKLSIHDEYIYQESLEQMNNMKSPFFFNIFTSSSHSPYDQPGQNYIDFPDEDHRPFLNSVYYSDSALYDFIQKGQSKPWYNNTLFVMVSDHSHISPQKRYYFEKQQRRIPLLFFGPLIKEEFKGKQFNQITGQYNLPALLLAQLNMDASAYQWSRNPLDSCYNAFAYYEADQGYGWVSDNSNFVYHFGLERTLVNQVKNDSIANLEKTRASAYLQSLFEDYLNY